MGRVMILSKGVMLLIQVLVIYSRKKFRILDTSRYLDLPELCDFLKKLSVLAPKSMKLESIGNTYIKDKDMVNEIFLVTIGNSSAPILFFDCGIHARDWISPATCLFLIQELVIVFENRQYLLKRPGMKKWRPLLHYQWQIVPMLNPDGYSRSHEKETHGGDTFRMHRKNMRPLSAMNISDSILEKCHDDGGCLGVDLNRNFPSGWGEGHKTFVVDSSLPWTGVYKGPTPLSEPETLALHKHIKTIRPELLSAISVHSYGKDIYYPKGYLEKGDPDQIRGDERKFLRRFAGIFNKALNFRVGSVSELLSDEERCGGATDDYYWTHWGVNISYTIELDPDINNHKVGFTLPGDKIESVGKKMFHAIGLMAKEMDAEYPHLVTNVNL